MPTNGPARSAAPKILFIAALAISASGMVSPPVALTAGILFGLTFAHPYAKFAREGARFLLQASVVALGFGMNLHEVLKAGAQRIPLHRGGDCLRAARGPWNRQAA